MNRPDFKSPDDRFRGLALWAWNDEPNSEELRRQIRVMKEAGWSGFFIHNRPQLLVPYLSPRFMEMVRVCVEEARALGMTAWLYDEECWPSGFGGGRVPRRGEEYRTCGLLCRALDQPVEDGAVLVGRDGDRAFYQWRAPLGHFWFFGASYVDNLNPETGQAFLEEIYEPYRREFGEDFGGVVPGIFTDEPAYVMRPFCPNPIIPWTPRLPELFEQRWGYRITDHLASLFRDVGDYRVHRYRYWRTVSERFMESYFKQLGEWCREHGLAFTGHLMGEDTLRMQLDWTGVTMWNYPHFDIPAVDHLERTIWNSMKVKQCTSVASQLRRERVLCEIFGCGGQNLSFEDRKWIVDWHLVLGVNMFTEHLVLYSMKGERKRDYPPVLFFQQPWWPSNRLYEDYVARISYALTEGEREVDVLVLHPIETAFTCYRPPDEWHIEYFPGEGEFADELGELSLQLLLLNDNLLGNQRDFDYGDESPLEQMGRVTDKGLEVGRGRYRVVILPHCVTLRETTRRLLAEFVAAGGAVLYLGDFPRLVEGVPDPTLRELRARCLPVDNEIEALRAQLDRLAPRDLRVIGEDGKPLPRLWLQRRRDGSRHIFFFANVSRREHVRGELLLRESGDLEEWDPATGEVRPVEQVARGDGWASRLELPPAGSALWVWDQSGTPVAPKPKGRITQLSLAGGWRGERLDPNALPIDHARFRTSGEGEWSEDLPVIAIGQVLTARHYEGPVEVLFEFEVDPAVRVGSMKLVVEEPETAEIALNGTPIRYEGEPYYWDTSFLPIAIGPLVNPGRNEVIVRRHFCPAQPASEEKALRTGTALEPVIVLGDFAVPAVESDRPSLSFADEPRELTAHGGTADMLGGTPPGLMAERMGLPDLRVRRYRPGFALAPEGEYAEGDLTAQGLLFYAGRMLFRREVELDQVPMQAWLELSQLDAIHARVRVNGEEAGEIVWAPYRVEVGRLLKPGRNVLEVELVNSLRNLLGPHHHPQGEPIAVGPGDFSGVLGWFIPEGEPEWLAHRGTEKSTWIDDYFVIFFGLTETRLVLADS